MSTLEFIGGAWLLVSVARIAHNLGRLAGVAEAEENRRARLDERIAMLGSSDVIPISSAVDKLEGDDDDRGAA